MCDESQTRRAAHAIHHRGVDDQPFDDFVCAFYLTAVARNLKMSIRERNMLVQTSQGQSGSAHVVVLGNEKGGSGKSTTALHIAVALLKAGQRVATIDLDPRQQSFTHYIENRRAWGERARVTLEMPTHYCVARAEGNSLE